MDCFSWSGILSFLFACGQLLNLQFVFPRAFEPSRPSSFRGKARASYGGGFGLLNSTVASVDMEEDGMKKSNTVSAFENVFGLLFAGAQWKCIDLAGGNTQNGNKIQIWDCNGKDNQKWIFNPGSWSIHSHMNPNKCIDAPGGAFNNGDQLQIWDCVDNGGYPIDGQKFGYDSNAKTIYATNTNPKKCFDLNGGSTNNGNKIQVWDCDDSNTNQRWNIYGGSPSPSPGSATLGKDWPTFNSASELQSSPWGKYFTTVYGAFPSQFPIHTSWLWMIYGDVAKQSGITIPNGIAMCPKQNKDLDLYTGVAYVPKGTIWIWHWQGFGQVYGPSPGNSWAEVIHKKDPFGDEHYGAWFLYAYGSGIYFWTGRTEVFNEHSDAYRKFNAHSNEPMCRAAAASGLDSVQFIKHHDPTNWPCQWSKKQHGQGFGNMGYEIVGVKLKGAYGCASDGKDNFQEFKSGWCASRPCNCKEGGYLNCGNF